MVLTTLLHNLYYNSNYINCYFHYNNKYTVIIYIIVLNILYYF